MATQYKQTQTESLPELEDAIKQLKIPFDELRPSNTVVQLGGPPVLLQPAAGVDKVEEVKVAPKVVGIRDSEGKLLTFALSATISSSKRTSLFFDPAHTRPFVVSYISFAWSQISWQAGNGWPVFTVPCPREDYHLDAFYRDAKFLSLVLQIGNTYMVPCVWIGTFQVSPLVQVIV
jgi:hypothetical protein